MLVNLDGVYIDRITVYFVYFCPQIHHAEQIFRVQKHIIMHSLWLPKFTITQVLSFNFKNLKNKTIYFMASQYRNLFVKL